ncbi:MAG: hypothetical protein JJU37_10610 [Balneolaceae bacterium]|nr:hypothetical protein [Balneolaceae bacterium]
MKFLQTYRPVLVLLLTIGLCFKVDISEAQISPSSLEYPYNHLSWYTIETEHFMIHYQEGNSRTAQVVAAISDDIYEPITSLYNYRPKRKISIILRDREDYSNGAAFFYDNKIEIWIPALDTPLRGTHQWLQNVITHEFAHMVQLGASMRRSQRIPAIYFQWLNYEDVRRPDILYGFPNGIITFPFSGVSIPVWFAEGTAQFMRENIHFDFWDNHRDMILRTRILSNTYLGLDEMGSFTSKSSLDRETIYNQGFRFTQYLSDRFGERILAELSQTAAETGTSNFNTVIEKTTGIPAQTLFDEWIAEKTDVYTEQSESLNITETVSVEENGFMNFFPQIKNGTLAYLTNRNRDFGRTALVLIKNGEEIEVDETNGTDFLNPVQQYSVSHSLNSNASLDFISNRFSFSPDGDQIAYSRPKKNRYGETYQDIYLYHIERESKSKITESARIQDPAWHPSENKLVAVQLHDGTQNIVLINLDDNSVTSLTNFTSGETMFAPVWGSGGESILFSKAHAGNRNIYRFDLDTNQIKSLLPNSAIDNRDIWQNSSSGAIYFSSDISGIFNIYRMYPDSDTIKQLTDILGGAFMPFVNDDYLYFSEYKSDGYKISKLSDSNYRGAKKEISLWDADYTENTIVELYSKAQDIDSNATESGLEQLSIQLTEQHPEWTWRPYTETTTGLSIYPVVRFDNYTKLRGSNSRLLTEGRFGNLGQNLWRDMKAGAYFESRDVTESFSIFGGALLGWGSLPSDGLTGFFSPTRLNNMDRDLFLIFDYRGLPFLKRSWSPTISVELYNLKRNVRDGISIEEFPCTSCLPVDRSIDIRYNMWEANLFLRSKINRWSLVELGASYSPYSVNIDGFFSQEFNEFIPGSTSEYFRGNTYSASYIMDATLPTIHSDIAPTGLKGNFTYRFQPGRLLQEFEVNDGVLSPVYSNDYNHSLELRSRLGFKVSSSVNALITTRAFSYLNSPEDFFYLDYTGGLGGMMSYPYFALGGQRTFFARTSLLKPVFTSINRQINAYTLDKVFAHIFFETGNGWGGPLNIGDNLKTGIGAELRFSFNSYYLFPMKFFVNSTYGLNRFDVTLPSDFITTSGLERVQYGRELLFYFGLTFDFDVL